MQSYQTLAARPRQSLTLVATAVGVHSNKSWRREIAGDPLDFRLDKRYIGRSFRLVTSLRFVSYDAIG
jgi:hypothetical protein